MTTRLTSLLLLGLSVFTLAGCGGGATEKKIVILTNGNSPFWDAAASGATAAGNDLNLIDSGYRVVFERNDFTVEKQLEKLKQFAGSSDVVAVGISVTDSNNEEIADQLRVLRKQGIAVITIDSDVSDKNRDARFGYLGTNNQIAGEQLGQAVQKLNPEGGKYATFVGLKGATNAMQRIGGFQEGAGAAFEQVENMGDGGDENQARQNVRDALDRHADLTTLVGIWSYNTPAIVDTVKDKGKLTIAAFDADPPTIEALAQKKVDVMIVQNPYQMGYKGVKLLHALVEKDDAYPKELFPDDGDVHDTGLKIVVHDEESRLTEQDYPEKKAAGDYQHVEFLRLKDFRAWLTENGLRGS